MEAFKALWAENIDAKVETTVRPFKKEDLPDGEVLAGRDCQDFAISILHFAWASIAKAGTEES